MSDNLNQQANDNAPSGLKRRTKGTLMLAAIVIISLITAIIIYIIHTMKYQSTDDAFIDAHIVQISPKVSGIISKVYIDDNQKVKKGDLLVEIDPKDYKVQLQQAKDTLAAAIAKQKGADINIGLTSIVSGAGLKQSQYGINFYQSGVAIAGQQIKIAKNNLVQAQSRIKQTQAVILQQQADVVSKKASVRLAEQENQRFKKLYDQGAVSKEQLDTVESELSISKANLESSLNKVASAEADAKSAFAAQKISVDTLNQANDQLDQAKASVGQAIGRHEQSNIVPQNVDISKTQFDTAKAQMKQLRAAVKQAELNLSYTKIYASKSGYITRRSAENGAYVEPGQALLAIVPDKIWVTANFKETQLTNMRPGQPASIKVDAYPHKRFKGHVDSIQRGTGARFSLLPPENAVGSYIKVVQRVPVKIVFDEQPQRKYVIAPGMSVVPEVKVK